MKKMYILLLFIAVSLGISAQSVVTGKVIDASTSEPLIGVTLLDKTTTKGTITDFDGNFSLEIAGQTTVTISYVGYETQEITLNTSSNGIVIKLKEESIGLKDVVVTSSIAIRRKTPVASATITPTLIEEKLGTQEFPEILKSTPGVYATKQGGGYGDSKINLRGFKSENIAVMVNGVPVNDMEWGGVYWSNWAGLSDVTRSMQVQRGLGASKVSSPAVGGSINIITRSTDMKRGGNVSYALGNDGYEKTAFTASTGLLENGWAFTFLGSYTKGDGYVQGTGFEGYSWFANISKQLTDNQVISLTAFGAPQKHYQRSRYDGLTIEGWKDVEKFTGPGNQYKFNPTYGYDANGRQKGAAYNYYNKPQVSLNHIWQINYKTNLSTVLYASFGRGGGYSGKGRSAYKSSWYGTTNGHLNMDFRNSDGTFNYGKVYEINEASTEGSQMIMSVSQNHHNWYGLLSTAETELTEHIKLSGGVDLRYYKGVHTNEITDLYGGSYYVDDYYRKKVKASNNVAAASPEFVNQKLQVGDVIYRDYDGIVMQEGLFGQVEGTFGPDDCINAFVSGAASNQSYQRIDRFYYDKAHQESDVVNKIGYNFKGGINYNINEHHNVFMNMGMISKQPYFSQGIFVSSKDSHFLNPDPVNEEIKSIEGGYGFHWKYVSFNVNAYYTKWMNKTLTKAYPFRDADGVEDRYTVNMTGVNAVHSGIEFDGKVKPTKWLTFTAMASLGQWNWDGKAEGLFYNSQGDPIKDNLGTVASGVGADDHAKMTLDMSKVPVGGSAQLTAAFGANVKLTKGLRVGMDYTFAGQNYADWNFNSNDLVLNGEVKLSDSPWQLPDYGTCDANMSYKFKVGGLNAKVSANVNNVFDSVYITDAMDGTNHDWQSAYRVFYGFGRTWSMRFKINF